MKKNEWPRTALIVGYIYSGLAFSFGGGWVLLQILDALEGVHPVSVSGIAIGSCLAIFGFPLFQYCMRKLNLENFQKDSKQVWPTKGD